MQTIQCPTSPVRRFALLGARIALLLTLVVVADRGFAAKVYRCGNLFQDQPCDADRTTATRPAVTPPAAAPAPAKAATRPTPGANDRLVLDPPATAVIQARR